MWGAQGVSRSAGTLDSHVWRLRRLLEPGRARGAAPTVLVREPGGYRLVVGADAVDSARFAVLAAEAGDLLASALIIHWVGKPDWSIVVGDLRLLC
jgi:DNA-binding SARP family transcriptional activator